MKVLKKQEQLAEYAKAMAHPVRLYILFFLKSQRFCYTGQLTEELPFSQATISQHLKALKNAGLIKGKIETPKIKYCIDDENWKTAENLFKELFKNRIKGKV